MSESFGDDLDRHARGDEQRRVGVAEVVQSDAGELELADLAIEELVQRLGVDRLSARVGEHRIAETGCVAIALLTSPPSCEDRFGVAVEVDAAPARSGLDRYLDGTATDDLAAARDRQPVRVIVPVAPAEPGDLPAPHAGRRGEVERGGEPQVLRGAQELHQLGCGPALRS